MNVQTVAENLRRTIAGKELYLAECNKALNVKVDPLDAGERMAITATKEFLEININELKVILFDVEQCIAKDVEQSWRDNPDRSGGQFTQDEIDNAGRWQ
jgi:hypothetical protein